jgi:hypothetical protein
MKLSPSLSCPSAQRFCSVVAFTQTPTLLQVPPLRHVRPLQSVSTQSAGPSPSLSTSSAHDDSAHFGGLHVAPVPVPHPFIAQPASSQSVARSQSLSFSSSQVSIAPG